MSSNSSGLWPALSKEIAEAVRQAGNSVVSIYARPHVPSSGVYWQEGIVVTADHTVRREQEIGVELGGGARVSATLAGRDPSTDLAVLRLGEKLPAAVAVKGETSGLTVGNLVLAVGRNRLGSVVAAAGILGTVSDAFRTWRGGRVDQYIRPDIALFPGFSGGALLNGEGKVLGVNTSAFQRRGGMTMPASTVNRVVGELLEKGHVSRPYLGLAMQPVRLAKAQRDKMKLGSEYGILVVHVEPDGPADKAGLLVGDLLLQIGDKAVNDTDNVQEILGTLVTGKSVSVGLIRGGAPLSLSITIGERPRR